MRPDLRLAFEAEEQAPDRRAAIGTTKPTLRVHPYLAVYVVQLTPDGEVWDGDYMHPAGRFTVDELEDALDFAENISLCPALFHLATARSTTPVKGANAIVVNNHEGKEQARYRLGWVQVVQSPPKKQTPWLWKMLGWWK